MTNTHPLWSDDYWILVLQLYMRKPVGMKPMYSRAAVELCIELHIPPAFVYARMYALRRLEAPSLRRLWSKYSQNPRRLAHDARTVRRMKGFGCGNLFYEGVETRESFERDFLPIAGNEALKPVMLIISLNLYFRLMPQTMVADTPEVRQTARMMKISAEDEVYILAMFRRLDPFLNGGDTEPKAGSELMKACLDVWQRFGNGNPEELSATAALMRDYFKSPAASPRTAKRRQGKH